MYRITHTKAPSAAVTKECCCCIVADSKEGETIGLTIFHGGRESEGIGPLKKNVAFFTHLLGLSSEAERNPLKKRASSATLNA